MQFLRGEWSGATSPAPASPKGARAGGSLGGCHRPLMTKRALKANGYGGRWHIGSFFSGLKRFCGSTLTGCRRAMTFQTPSKTRLCLFSKKTTHPATSRAPIHQMRHCPFPRFVLILALALCAHVSHAEPPAPEVTVSGHGELREDAPTGVTGRPEWTGARRFSGTRVYIQQELWEAGVESWWRIKKHRDGTISNRLLEEVEIGLPWRMQLDLYNDIEGNQHGDFHYQSFNVELRWALADWGKIWGNPTLYGEYKFADAHWGPDVYEFKVLFGDQLAQRWHWGVNFVWEAETGGEREQEFQITGGLSYTVIDSRLGVGVECLYDRDTVAGGRSSPANQFNIGPSVQYRVTGNLHIDLSCMFGTNHDSDRVIGFLVVGYDFGPGSHSKRIYTPVSGRQN